MLPMGLEGSAERVLDSGRLQLRHQILVGSELVVGLELDRLGDGGIGALHRAGDRVLPYDGRQHLSSDYLGLEVAVFEFGRGRRYGSDQVLLEQVERDQADHHIADHVPQPPVHLPATLVVVGRTLLRGPGAAGAPAGAALGGIGPIAALPASGRLTAGGLIFCHGGVLAWSKGRGTNVNPDWGIPLPTCLPWHRSS